VKNLRSKAEPAFEYLALLSVKYEVHPDKLYHALNMAEEHNKSECGDLEIRCRGKTKDKAVFLILKDSRVVAQFPIFKESLLNQNHPKDPIETDKIRRLLAEKTRRTFSSTIRDLKKGMTRINLTAKVLNITEPSTVYTRYGNSARVASALIGDETGTIKLCLWNDQISSISAGNVIQIRNARTSIFRGEKQLNLGKRGLLNCVDNSNHALNQLLPH
jgi:replication factor A1